MSTNNVSPFPKERVSKSALIGIKPPLIMPGEYEATFFAHAVKIMFRGGKKLYLTFIVRDEGKDFALQKYYNLTHIFNDGTFETGYKSNLFRDYVRLFDYPLDEHNFTSDMIIQAFEGKRFLCEVKSVLTDSQGNSLPIPLQYSIIERIRKVIYA